MTESFRQGDLVVVVSGRHKGKVGRIFAGQTTFLDFDVPLEHALFGVRGDGAEGVEEGMRLPGTEIFLAEHLAHYRKEAS